MNPSEMVQPVIYLMDHAGKLRGAIRASGMNEPYHGGTVIDWESGVAYVVTSVRRAGAEIHFEGRRLAA